MFSPWTLAEAQQPADSTDPAALPDAPTARTTVASPSEQPPAESQEGQQTKRILGIIPNFRSVSVNSHPPPQTAGEKFNDFAHDSFDYSAIIFVGGLAGIGQLQGSEPEFGSGAPAYGRYFWHTFADQTNENFLVGFVLPVALKEDARYYTLGRNAGGKHHGVLERTGYAFSRILVTRTDAGGSRFNFSEVIGSGAAAGISNAYYPATSTGWNKTGQRWLLNVGLDGLTFVFKEFWPDINKAVFHSK
jgi:hypothetical protein